MMGINEEIFEGFFKKLEENEDFPRSVIEELKKLWESGEIASQEEIFKAIKRGCTDVREDQED